MKIIKPKSQYSIGLIERKKLYASAQWRDLRAKMLRKYPACMRCGAPATVLDHALGHGPGWRQRFWRGPFQSLCQSCHSTKTTTEEQHTRMSTRLRHAPWRKGK